MSQAQRKIELSESQLPIIDLTGYFAGDGARSQAAVKELRDALETIGFFIITGHGLDWSLVEQMYAQAKRFFDLPAERKNTVAVDSGSFADLLEKRGYIGFVGSGEYRGGGNRTALVESYYFDTEASPKNQWIADLPGFRETVIAYLRAVDALARRLLPIYARALDLNDDQFFDRYFTDPTNGLRLSHYPPPPADFQGWGLVPHTDRSFLTLLPSNDVAGLQVRPEHMDWMAAPAVHQGFVVNSGDILRRWSNDRFLSTPHRVAAPTVERYAIPYFFSPTGDAVLDPLPTCVTAERPARYPSISFDEFNHEFMKQSYVPDDKRLTD